MDKHVKRAKSYKLTNETKARVRIIAAQSFITEDEVVERAIDLLYSITPGSRDARVDLDELIADASERLIVFSDGDGEEVSEQKEGDAI